MVYITAFFITEQEVRQLIVLCGGQSVYTHIYTCLVMFRSAIIVAPHMNYTLGPHAHVQSTPRVHAFHRRLQLCRQWVQQHIGQGRRLPELMGQKERLPEWLIAREREWSTNKLTVAVHRDWWSLVNGELNATAQLYLKLPVRLLCTVAHVYTIYLCITPLKAWEWIMLIKLCYYSILYNGI